MRKILMLIGLCAVIAISPLHSSPASARVRVHVRFTRYTRRHHVHLYGTVWVPGYYVYNYDLGRYIWIEGSWEEPPYFGAIWIAPEYVTGYGYVAGHWGRRGDQEQFNRTLASRGYQPAPSQGIRTFAPRASTTAPAARVYAPRAVSPASGARAFAPRAVAPASSARTFTQRTVTPAPVAQAPVSRSFAPRTAAPAPRSVLQMAPQPQRSFTPSHPASAGPPHGGPGGPPHGGGPGPGGPPHGGPGGQQPHGGQPVAHGGHGR